MAGSDTKTRSRARKKPATPRDAKRPRDDKKTRGDAKPHDDEREEKAEIVEVVAEDGDEVEPPPPEIVEPDPELTPEEAEDVRKQYLLTRFWISARGYWGKSGDRLA